MIRLFIYSYIVLQFVVFRYPPHREINTRVLSSIVFIYEYLIRTYFEIYLDYIKYFHNYIILNPKMWEYFVSNKLRQKASFWWLCLKYNKIIKCILLLTHHCTPARLHPAKMRRHYTSELSAKVMVRYNLVYNLTLLRL